MQKRFSAILFVFLVSCSTVASTSYESHIALAPNATLERSSTGLSTYEQQVVTLVNGSRIYDYDLELENIALSHLAFRSGGSAGANEAANWVKQEFESFGLEARFEPFQFYNWTLLSKPSLIIDEDGDNLTTGDQTPLKSFQSEHYSWPAPAGGVFADLVVLPLPAARNRSEVGANPINMTAWNAINTTGRIVLIGKEIRSDANWEHTFLDKLTTQRPAAVVYTWWYSWISLTLPMYSSIGGLPRSIRFGSYYWDLQIPVACLNYGDGLWLRQREEALNVSASFSLESLIGYGSHYNVVGKISGYQNPDKLVIVSSHYDTVMCSGFCDNGAGTAAIVELANVFSDAIEDGLYKPRYTLLFVAFADEELWLVGSTNYVKQHKNDMPNTIAVINLDMIGNECLNVTNTDPADAIDLDELVVGAAQDLNIGITAGEMDAGDGDSFRVPSEVNDFYCQIWGLDPDISDAEPVNSSTMIFSYPDGWIHTAYDNSTSTGTLNWVEPENLEDQVEVAALSIMRVSAPVATLPQREWMYATGGAIDSSPAVADVDGNGQLEVVIGSNDNIIYCLDGATGTQKWGYETGAGVYSSPVIADVYGDGQLEVLVGSWDKNVYCLNGSTGAKLWNYTTGKRVYSSPVVADVDGDGHLEVLVGSWDGSIYCLNGRTGDFKWSYTTGARVFSSPAVADADGDGRLEVLVGSEDSQVYCLDGSTGAKLWNYATGRSVESSPVVADVDGDGHLGVFVGSLDNRTYCLNGATGAQKWNHTMGGWVWSSPAIVDVDDDNHLEVVVGSEDNQVYCLNAATGEKRWNYTTGDLIDSSPAVADLDGDGRLEVLVGSLDNRTYCLNGATGAQKWNYITGNCIGSSPIVADINGDGHLELLVGSEDKNIYCLSVVGAPFNASACPWPSIGFCSDVRHSGCYVDSDYEGLMDGYEVTAGTDPRRADTDTDGFTDYQEFLMSSNPLLDEIPPAAITNLVIGSVTDTSITLTWTAPGDNGNSGNATGYWVKYSTSGRVNDSNWASATNYTQSWAPVRNGSTETHMISGLAPGTTYWFALRAYDEAHNFAGFSNSPSVTTGNATLIIIILTGVGGAVVMVVMVSVVLRLKKRRSAVQT